jgi:hypothetical protein
MEALHNTGASVPDRSDVMLGGGRQARCLREQYVIHYHIDAVRRR